VIAILVATALICARGASIANARPGPHTKVAGQLITGPGVELVKDHFTPHEGNERCGDDGPDRVDPSSHRNFCYWADKVWGTGAYDTEVSFRYKVKLSGGGVNGDSGYAVDGHVLVPFTRGRPRCRATW
jgi:hypothetical protein